MSDEKDRFGDKLRDVERGREDEFFARRDRELLDKIRRKKAADVETAQRDTARMRCPKCGEHLEERMLYRVSVDECPSCGGIWLDPDELEELALREREGWLGRLFRSRS